MSDTGKLEKLKIIAYQDEQMNNQVDELDTLINPESYQLDYKIEFNDRQGQGTSGTQQRYAMTKPELFSFDFLFDNTGIIDGKPRADVWDDIKHFKRMLVDFDGSIHQPRFFKLIWGVMIFKGRLAELNITFKLFKPDGTPIRAVAKTKFKGSVEERLRVAKENARSPDLTHERIVKAGDTLPLLCFQIYQDPKYYLQVAQANDWTPLHGAASDATLLTVGSTLYFPPIKQ